MLFCREFHFALSYQHQHVLAPDEFWPVLMAMLLVYISSELASSVPLTTVLSSHVPVSVLMTWTPSTCISLRKNPLFQWTLSSLHMHRPLFCPQRLALVKHPLFQCYDYYLLSRHASPFSVDYWPVYTCMILKQDIPYSNDHWLSSCTLALPGKVAFWRYWPYIIFQTTSVNILHLFV